MQLSRWQHKDILVPLFDTRLTSGLRQYRTCYVEVPRKNAKSTLGSGIALYMLLYDREPGAEIVSAAADRDQAAIVFDIAKSMVEANPVLSSICQIYRREIVVPSTASTYKVISSEAYSKHGMNLHGAIVDEVHAHPNSDLYDVLGTSFGSRRQPLMFCITTAGYDRSDANLCWKLHTYAEKVIENPELDQSFKGVIYGAPMAADWKDPKIWALANPGLGVTIKREYVEQECRRAQEIPSYQNTFRRLHLNQWTESSEAWLPMDKWDLGAVPVDDESLRGRHCFGGLDLSTTTDLSAFVLVFPGETLADGFDVLSWAWCPADGVRDRSRKDRAPYEQWVRDGYLTATEGNGVDYDVIREHIEDLATKYSIREIGYDKWNSHQIVTQLQRSGAEMVPINQQFSSLTAPSKELEKLVLTGKIRHGGHPVLRWCISNTVVERDGAKNMKPSKKKSTERIDLTVALVMALARAINDLMGASVYDKRGVVAL